MRVRGHLKDPGVDALLILQWIFKNWDESMEWIDLAQNWDGGGALVNEILNIAFP